MPRTWKTAGETERSSQSASERRIRSGWPGRRGRSASPRSALNHRVRGGRVLALGTPPDRTSWPGRRRRDERRSRAGHGMVAVRHGLGTGMDLFSPVTLGDIELANRVVMAPLTRMRSGAAGVPGDLVVEHYRQRASLGMIITEGTYPNHEGQAFVGQPGIVTDEQVEGWRRVADAVHARGGKIVLQVMHGGRVTHPDVNGGRRV